MADFCAVRTGGGCCIVQIFAETCEQRVEKMADDLVKRLRKMVPHCSDPRDYPSDDADILEAADRIEALERDRDRWKDVATRLANSKAFDEREVIRREALEEAEAACKWDDAFECKAAIRKLADGP